LDVHEFLNRLERAVMLESDDAAIRVHGEYEPQAGPAAKVSPPTYLESSRTRYHFEQRWGPDGEPVDVVVLDSYQSQANRCEAALKREAELLGLPQLVIETEVFGSSVAISSLDAPHRSRDAYFLDSQLGGKRFDDTDLGRALSLASADDAAAFLRYAPYDLVYGVWDSHRGKRLALKFPRSYTSEMIGWYVLRGKRAATKGDPLNLKGDDAVTVADWSTQMSSRQGRKAQQRLSELGHGMVPGQADDEAGGVSVRSITREGVLSLTGLSRFGFPVERGDANRAGRTALAALALAGDRLAFGRAGLHLRSGADLVLKHESIGWVGRGGSFDGFQLTPDDARTVLSEARRRLEEAGVQWSPDPVRLRPTAALQRAIEAAFAAVEANGEA
jgi:CRISPR-associated protein Csb1